MTGVARRWDVNRPGGAHARIRGRNMGKMTGMGSRIAALTAAGALLLAGCTATLANAADVTCDAGDWGALKTCIDAAPTDGTSYTVRLTEAIAVPGDKDAGFEAPVIKSGMNVTLEAEADTDGLTGLVDGSRVARTPSVFYVAPGGALTIGSGTYSDIHTVNGGVLVDNQGTLTVSGGRFERNSTEADGGVIVQNPADGRPAPTMTITGGIFSDNIASPAGCSAETAATVCLNAKGGGGAIHSVGNLTVSGGTFDHNGATHSHFNSGGGAIWAQGTLTIRNNGSTKPEFTGNWATVADPKGRDLAKDGILRGGAGGAVFLNNGSQATITGGTYTDNVSGYLGGAIYTEEGTTTYVGKAVATGNFAGHFGGGLWFCPSGNSAASKGGNIALWGNTVNADYDANPDNKVTSLPDGANSTTAGDDLAIMNPYYKKMGDNQFQLLNTWFTDRSEDAVTWTWDGAPLQHTSGYHDSWVHTAGGVTQGIRAVLADSTLHKDQPQGPGTITLTRGKADEKDNKYDTGFALKANLTKNADTTGAENAAQLVMTGNAARMSGGAFGSNGVVIFDSPYSVDWNKTGSDTKGEPIKAKSTWKISIASTDLNGRDTPYYDPDMRPSDCLAVDSAKAECWGHDDPDTEAAEKDESRWYVRVEDNDDHDNNRTLGSLSLDNLAPGTYTLEETTPPDGYVKTNDTYTFTITPTQAGQLPIKPVFKKNGNPMDSPDIVNTPKSGSLEWSKTDADSGARVGGSEWKIVGNDGQTVEGYDKITDCTSGEGGKCDGLLDQDPLPGKFGIALGGKLTKGSYTLVETNAPDGYLTPKDADHAFTIEEEGNGYKATFAKDAGPTIANTPTDVKWVKVGSDDTDTPLKGSEWRLTGPDKLELDVTDCIETEASKCTGADKDPKAGVFRITALKPGSYTLTETKAPVGYAKSDTSYTFDITADDMTEAKWKTIVINGATPAGDSNRIVNTKTLTALPLTGGRSALDWLVTGGTLAVLAMGVAVVADRMRRRAFGR